MTARAVRRTALAAVFVLPLSWLLYLALLEPKIEFLTPGRGRWVVDPRWRIARRSPELFPPTRYRLVVPRPPVPAPIPIRVSALGRFRLAVNGGPWLESGATEQPWRRPVALDLASRLAAGDNELLIEVSNDSGPTPLRVVGRLPDGGTLTTGRAPWQAAIGGEGWVPAVAAGGGERHLAGKELPARVRLAVALGLAAVGALALAGLLRRGRAAATRPAAAAAGGDHRPPRLRAALQRHGLALAAVAVVAAAALWNAWRFPFERSRLDWGGHSEHIRYAARTWRPPLAEEGWQMYQPPLYYWLAGTVWEAAGGDQQPRAALRQVQRAGGWIGVLHALVVWRVLVRHGPESPAARALAILAAGLAPAALTTGAMITNEPFAGLACAVPLVVGAAWLAGGQAGLMKGLALGALCGLALLSKFTGLLSLAALVVGLAAGGLEEPGGARRRWVAALGGLLVAAAAIAGPYYLRNLRVYGKAFVGNWDRASGQDYEQEPGYRTAAFYARFGEIFFHLPERARWSSLWDGLYGSTWGEIHDNFLSAKDAAPAPRAVAVFVLALLPTAAALAGFGATVAKATAPGAAGRAELVWVAATVFGLASLAAFTLVVPFVSVVKAFFLLYLTAPAALFAARGFERMERGLGRARPALYGAALAQAALTLSLYLWR
jgi:hypothetical protein